MAKDSRPPEPPIWLTTTEVRKWLGGVDVRTVYNLIETGQLPGYKWGRHTKVKLDDVLELIERSRVEPTRLGESLEENDE